MSIPALSHHDNRLHHTAYHVIASPRRYPITLSAHRTTTHHDTAYQAAVSPCIGPLCHCFPLTLRLHATTDQATVLLRHRPITPLSHYDTAASTPCLLGRYLTPSQAHCATVQLRYCPSMPLSFHYPIRSLRHHSTPYQAAFSPTVTVLS